MKRIPLIMLIASALVSLAAGCSPASATTPLPPVSLAAPGASEAGQIRASAVVTPALESRLSFLIPGTVAEVTVKEGDQVQAGQALVKLNTIDLEYDIIGAEAALTAAETETQVQRQPRKRFNFDSFQFEYLSAPGELILEAESRAEQRRWALEAAKATLAQGTLAAPFAGTVVEVNVAPGEYVQPAQVLIVIATLEDLQVETTDLSELNVAAVKTGQPATVFVEALGEAFPGQVSAIAPISDTIGGDVVFKVTVELEEQSERLRWGMSADVEINVE
jgi:RND family efflux transporter MFP subunit